MLDTNLVPPAQVHAASQEPTPTTGSPEAERSTTRGSKKNRSKGSEPTSAPAMDNTTPATDLPGATSPDHAANTDDGEEPGGAEPALHPDAGTALVHVPATASAVSGTATTDAAIEATVDQVVSELRALHHEATVVFRIRCAEIVVERIFGGDLNAARKPGSKDVAMHRLVEHPDLPVSARDLYRSVAVYGMLREQGRLAEVQTSARWGFSALEIIATAPPAKQPKLLADAEDGKVTVEHLRKAVAKLDKKPKGGRAAKSGIVKAVGAIERAAKAIADSLDNGEQVDAADLDSLRGKLAAAAENLAQAAKRVTAAPAVEKKGEAKGGKKEAKSKAKKQATVKATAKPSKKQAAAAPAKKPSKAKKPTAPSKKLSKATSGKRAAKSK